MGLLKKIKRAINTSYDPIVYQAACGHMSQRKGWVEIFGERHHFKFSGDPCNLPYCLDCLAKGAIRCAWCGEPILYGSPVTLYTPLKEDFVIPDHAVVYSKSPLQLVGCLVCSGADGAFDRAGFWQHPGKVVRVPSPTEMAMSTNGVVITEDVSNPNLQ